MLTVKPIGLNNNLRKVHIDGNGVSTIKRALSGVPSLKITLDTDRMIVAEYANTDRKELLSILKPFASLAGTWMRFLKA